MVCEHSLFKPAFLAIRYPETPLATFSDEQETLRNMNQDGSLVHHHDQTYGTLDRDEVERWITQKTATEITSQSFLTDDYRARFHELLADHYHSFYANPLLALTPPNTLYDPCSIEQKVPLPRNENELIIDLPLETVHALADRLSQSKNAHWMLASMMDRVSEGKDPWFEKLIHVLCHRDHFTETTSGLDFVKEVFLSAAQLNWISPAGIQSTASVLAHELSDRTHRDRLRHWLVTASLPLSPGMTMLIAALSHESAGLSALTQALKLPRKLVLENYAIRLNAIINAINNPFAKAYMLHQLDQNAEDFDEETQTAYHLVKVDPESRSWGMTQRDIQQAQKIFYTELMALKEQLVTNGHDNYETLIKETQQRLTAFTVSHPPYRNWLISFNKEDLWHLMDDKGQMDLISPFSITLLYHDQTDPKRMLEKDLADFFLKDEDGLNDDFSSFDETLTRLIERFDLYGMGMQLERGEAVELSFEQSDLEGTLALSRSDPYSTQCQWNHVELKVATTLDLADDHHARLISQYKSIYSLNFTDDSPRHDAPYNNKDIQIKWQTTDNITCSLAYHHGSTDLEAICKQNGVATNRSFDKPQDFDEDPLGFLIQLYETYKDNPFELVRP